MKETLTSRLIDRPIRPLFPVGFNDEVQVQASVLASDRQTDGDVLAMNGASAALCVSELPFHGPIGSVRLAQVKIDRSSAVTYGGPASSHATGAAEPPLQGLRGHREGKTAGRDQDV